MLIAGERVERHFNRLSNLPAALRAQWYLRRAACLGPRVRLWGRPAIHIRGRMIIADRVQLVSTTAKLELAVEEDATLEIGTSTFINYGCSIAASQHIRIGAHCSIGTHVIIMDSDYHELSPERRHIRAEPAPIELEDNVWVCARAIVLKGVTIGHGSVIGAGSVVTRDIPPRSLAVGQPARVIRSL